jgi:hypothetical protein
MLEAIGRVRRGLGTAGRLDADKTSEDNAPENHKRDAIDHFHSC